MTHRLLHKYYTIDLTGNVLHGKRLRLQGNSVYPCVYLRLGGLKSGVDTVKDGETTAPPPL